MRCISLVLLVTGASAFGGGGMPSLATSCWTGRTGLAAFPGLEAVQKIDFVEGGYLTLDEVANYVCGCFQIACFVGGDDECSPEENAAGTRAWSFGAIPVQDIPELQSNPHVSSLYMCSGPDCNSPEACM